MSQISALNELLTTILDRGARLIETRSGRRDETLEGLAADLVSARGEASGVAIAHALLVTYAAADAPTKRAFFEHLASAYNPDPDKALAAARAYAESRDPLAIAALFTAVEPPRQELLRRLNLAPDGTRALVAMRADLLTHLRDNPELRCIDQDFRHLLGSWFNRGFLVMRRIDWTTPAHLLEKIIAYEAVHEIATWGELRNRVAPPDRRCYAFFHPSMPDEPLIFVEVALTDSVPEGTADVLALDRVHRTSQEATTAVFYSISNCQAGLAGISFGAFLIKQVAHDLAEEIPGLETFVTLSPVPGFLRWLRAEESAAARDAVSLIDQDGWHTDPDRALAVRDATLPLAVHYFVKARRADGLPVDPVARFHLGNGAELVALNWLGDTSAKGLAEAAGLMVNYRYRLDRIEVNHEAYAENGTLAIDRSVRSLLG